MASTKKRGKSPKKVAALASRPVAPKKAAKIRGGSQSSGAGAGKATFNPFSITKKID